MRSTIFVLVAATLLLSARDARALDVALEIRPGAAIALGSFPDGLPLSIDDRAGDVLLAQPNSTYNILWDMDTAAGFTTAITLLLNQFTITAAISIHKWSTATATRFAIVKLNGTELPSALHNLYIGEITGSNEVDISSDSPTMILPRLTFGYRWYLLDTRLRPYIPLAGGISAIVLDGDFNFGLALQTGAGVEYRLTPWLDVGVAVHYEWLGFLLSENFTADAASDQIATQASSNSSVFEAFLESLHTVQLAATATVRF